MQERLGKVVEDQSYITSEVSQQTINEDLANLLIIKKAFYKSKKFMGLNPKYIQYLKREGLEIEPLGNKEVDIPLD